MNFLSSIVNTCHSDHQNDPYAIKFKQGLSEIENCKLKKKSNLVFVKKQRTINPDLLDTAEFGGNILKLHDFDIDQVICERMYIFAAVH